MTELAREFKVNFVYLHRLLGRYTLGAWPALLGALALPGSPLYREAQELRRAQ